MKRVFDILFAISFLIVFSPIYLLTAVMIMICSPGNPVYKAPRVGKGGRIFTCYKFRSMRVDSGQVRLTTLSNDERVFAFGKLIRKAKIDEFMQIFNILMGDMSVVGPRPEDKDNADAIYTGKYQRILDVRPGLTSPASLYDYTHGERCETVEEYERDILPRKLELELFYVEHQSFFYDLRLIVATALTIIQIVLGKRDFKEPEELSIIAKENQF